MAPKPARSEGARELAAIAKRGTVAAIAAKLGVDEAAVRNWIAGRRTPNGASRGRIAESYGIAVDAWSAPPRSTSHRPPPRPAQGASSVPGTGVQASEDQRRASGPVPAADGRGVLEQGPGPSTSLAAPGMTHRARLAVIVERLEAEIARGGADVPANHKAALYGQLQNAVGRVGRFDGDEQITVSAILRSRAWREIEAVLEQALRKHPDAAQAIAEALGAFVGAEPSP